MLVRVRVKLANIKWSDNVFFGIANTYEEDDSSKEAVVTKRMFLAKRMVFSKSLDHQLPTKLLQSKYFWQSPQTVYVGRSHSHDICMIQ